jgi:hypothetical protein
MVKNWRTAKVAVVATATALTLCGGTAAADAGGAVSASPPAHGWHHLWIDRRVAPHGPFGTVTSVNGVSTAGTCGTADSSGVFTVTAWKNNVDTVDVTATTTFVDPASSTTTTTTTTTGASFADVCVGDPVAATGSVNDDSVTASGVYNLTPCTSKPRGPAGTVTPAPRPATTAVVMSPAPHNAPVDGAPSADPTSGFGSHPGGGNGAPRIPGPGATPATYYGPGWPTGGPFHGGEPGSRGHVLGGPASSGWSGQAHGRP